MKTQFHSLAAAIALATILHGQSITGDLVVNVTDPAGAAVSGAALSLVQVETNVKLEARTDALGQYLFSQLRPGHYVLEVSAAGFQKANVTDIVITIGQSSRVDTALTVGAVNETVNVSAAAETMLTAESASIGQALTNQAIVELPLNGRDFIQLAQISSGAAPIGIGNSPATSWTGRPDQTLSIAGGRETNNSFLVDGIETRNSRFGSVGIRPSPDAIEEFSVQRTTYGAELGRSAGIINTTIRSGTNDLHLSVYEFLRNRDLNANSFFGNLAGAARPAFVQNNFGTAVGAPVMLPHYRGRNKTFWFFNYEGFRQRQSNLLTGLYPTPAQMAGNLADDSAGSGIFPLSSAVCQANPTSKKCHDVIDPSSSQPFPGNVIPSNRLDPIVQKILPYLPKPNVVAPANSPVFPLFNTQAFPKTLSNWDQYNVRLDHHLTSRDVLYGTFSNSSEALYQPAIQPLGGQNYPQSDRLYTVTYNRIINPSMINEFRFGYNRSITYRQSETANTQNYASQVFGLKNTSTNPFDFGVPDFNATGFGGTGSLSEAIGATDTNIQFTDNFRWNRGKNDIALGFTISPKRYDEITDFSGNPAFTFTGQFTGMQGLGIGDMLLGLPFTASAALGDSSQKMRTTYYDGYLQDNWRVTANLTLNLGVRYEFAAWPTETSGKALAFAPDLGVVIQANHGVRASIVDPDYNNFAPRVGFAYRPSFAKNTVVRGGFGTFYSTDNWNELQFEVMGPPFYQSQTLTSSPTTPTLLMSQLLPSLTANPNVSPFTLDRRNRTPYVNQWSLGVQRTLRQNYLLEVEYVGSVGQKLEERRNLNAGALDPTGVIPLASRRPYPQYANILLSYDGGWSSYQALTARLERRFSAGLYLLASYTWQKAEDLGITDESSGIGSNFKLYDKGVTVYDVPQRFVSSYVYELPFGRGKRFGGSAPAVVNKIAGGWQLTGITTFSKGQFQTPTIGVDWLNIGSFDVSRPSIIGDITTGRSLPYHYINPSAFNYPTNGAGQQVHVEGTAGRNSIEQPGLNNWDLGIVKNTHVGERFNVQLRCEMFDAWNHTQYGAANLVMTNPNFGKSTSTLVSARLVQLGLRLKF